MDADAVFDVLERLDRRGRRVCVVGLRHRLHVVLDGSVMCVGRGQADAIVWLLPGSAQQNERRQNVAARRTPVARLMAWRPRAEVASALGTRRISE